MTPHLSNSALDTVFFTLREVFLTSNYGIERERGEKFDRILITPPGSEESCEFRYFLDGGSHVTIQLGEVWSDTISDPRSSMQIFPIAVDMSKAAKKEVITQSLGSVSRLDHD